MFILNFIFFSTQVLLVDERLVSAFLYFLMHSAFANLSSQYLVKCLMLLTISILLVNVLKTCLFVFFEALLDVFFLLFQLKLSTVITNDIAHAIHDSLNTSASLSHFLLPCNFFFTYHAHIGLDLVSIGLLLLLKLSHSLFSISYVILDHFHCSLSFFDFFVCFSNLFFLDFGR